MKYIFLFLLLFLFACWKEFETTIDEEFEKKQIILALWDSLTAGYWLEEKENYPFKLQKKLDQSWYNFEVINAWVSWDTSANILSRAELYLEKKPNIVILVVWWNDWLRWLSTNDMKKNILDIIETFPYSKIVLWWMDIPENLWIKYRNDFKNVYKEIVKEKNDVYFLEFFLEWVAWKKELNLDDMIHPNANWYDIIVKNVFEFLEKNKIITK